MSRLMRDLDSRFRPIAEELVRYLQEDRHIDITIVDTLRTVEEQQNNVRNGVSWTSQSKHLPQPTEGKSWAIDLAPTILISTKSWSPRHPLWWEISRKAKALGLRSGMDWNDIGIPPVGHTREHWDPGHCEWRGPQKEST